MRVRTGRTVPVTDDTDVTVIGGGIAGVAAACAAAREGARVLLVEQSAQLGGVATLGGVNGFCFTGPLRALGDALESIVARLRAAGAMGAEHGWPEIGNETYGTYDYLFDIAALPLVLQAECEARGVSLLFRSTLCDALLESGRVTHEVVQNQTPLHALAARAVVDCTGCGALSSLAGGALLLMSESTIPPALTLLLRERAGAAPGDVPDAGERFKVMALPEGDHLMKINLMGVSTDDARALSHAEADARRRMPDWVALAGQRAGRAFRLVQPLPQLAVRHSARVRGEYVLTGEDIRAGRRFPDAVAYGSFTLDTVTRRAIVPPYQIPLRCLVAAGPRNVAVAGRCLSADTEAMSSARIMATSALCGEAAGTAAALCALNGVDMNAVPARDVRERLVAACREGPALAEQIAP